MPEEKVFIKKIITNNGTELSFCYDDIVVFVGPNNSGKSQSLHDIFNLSDIDNRINPIVISKIEKEVEKIDPISYLKRFGKQNDDKFFSILGESIYAANSFGSKNDYGRYRNLFIANLNTENRLSISKPPKNNVNEFSHPILYAAYNDNYRKWLSLNFKKAFGKDLNPNSIYGDDVSLCIGDSPVFKDGDFENDIERLNGLRQVLNTYPKIHQQGDGMKSFVGVLLYLMLPFYKTFLIDEPESFLHQPQAVMMGRIIGESTINRQCFISTHSEDLIKGLLDSAPTRVKIVRIMRSGNINNMSYLDNEKLLSVWKSPILKHSNIMSGIFYNNVVICESDADCKMYSIINDCLKKEDRKYPETLFVHCGGKHRMSDVSIALKSLGVDTRIIVDIDLLEEEQTLKKMIESMGGQFDSIKKDYDIFKKSLDSKGSPHPRKEVAEEINNILFSSEDQFISNKEIKELKKCLKPNTVWDVLKQNGIMSVPAGSPTNSINLIVNELEKNNIFVVPVGELESFIKEVGGHGPQWVNEVLKQYPDFDNDIYKKIKTFVRKLNI